MCKCRNDCFNSLFTTVETERNKNTLENRNYKECLNTNYQLNIWNAYINWFACRYIRPLLVCQESAKYTIWEDKWRYSITITVLWFKNRCESYFTESVKLHLQRASNRSAKHEKMNNEWNDMINQTYKQIFSGSWVFRTIFIYLHHIYGATVFLSLTLTDIS